LFSYFSFLIAMNVLVTGGAGFIGSNLVRLLLSEGHEVTVFDSLVSGYRSNLQNLPIKRLVLGDIRDASFLDSAAEGAEVIFHLAASVGNARSIDHPFVDAEINVLGTLNVLEIARRRNVRKVVFSSSAGIFGELKTLPIAENHPVEPDSPYGASKLYAEKVSLAYAKLYQVEVVCLRYFNVFGVNQRYDAYGNVIPIFAQRLIFGEPITVFGDGEQTRDFINVLDVARANYMAGMNRGVSGAFNLGSGSSITINKLVEMIQEVSGLRTTVTFGPLRKGDVRHSRADISSIQNALGWQPQAEFKSALTEYMNWAKSAFSQAPL
jgi:nucleoside-diphosphate-sugar epimerase